MCKNRERDHHSLFCVYMLAIVGGMRINYNEYGIFHVLGGVMSSILLSISILTHGKNIYLRDCLESLQHLRQKISSELVIVDTGCDEVDRTIIDEYADEVVEFTWCDDFAAARNAGLSRCSGEWFLYIDDDEVFSRTEEIEKFFLSGAYKNYDMASICIRSLADISGTKYADFYGLRMVRREEDTHFEYAIHENLTTGGVENAVLHDVLKHYGYIYGSEDLFREKHLRNVLLLEKEIRNDANNMHFATHLANEYGAVKAYDKQKDFCEKYLYRTLDSRSKEIRPYRGVFYAGVLDAYENLSLWNRIIPMGRRAVSDDECSDLIKTYCFGMMALAADKLGNVAEAKNYGNKYRQAYTQYYEYEYLYSSLFFASRAYTREFYEAVEKVSGSDNLSVKLSISLMTSNRKTTIRKCLDSLNHLRQSIPCELVVVDTGCDEEMRAIVDNYADRVVAYQWCDDFAAARNAGLQECTGDWFLFLDDDEWFEDTEAIEEFFTSGAYRQYSRAYYKIRNYFDENGEHYSDTSIYRMARLTAESRFQGRIHELLYPMEGSVAYLDSMVYHFGYAYKTEEERVRHVYRNIVMLKKAFAEDDCDMHVRLHLAKEYQNVDEYMSMALLCRESIDLLKEKRFSQEGLYYSGFLCGYVYALGHMGDDNELQRTVKSAQQNLLTLPARITLDYWMANSNYRLANQQEALFYMQEYENKLNEYDSNVDAYEKQRVKMTDDVVAMSVREQMQEQKKLASQGIFVEDVEDRQSYQAYSRMKEIGSPRTTEEKRELVSLAFHMNERCVQEKLCTEYLPDETFYELGYVDALFTQCRYDAVLEQISSALKGKRIRPVETILLCCEGCIAAFRTEDYTLAHQYGEEYLQVVSQYGSGIPEDNCFLVTAARESNQRRIKAILDELVPAESLDPRTEMEQLGQQIVAQARMLMESGDSDSAKSVLDQLLAMMPGYQDAIELLEQYQAMDNQA